MGDSVYMYGYVDDWISGVYKYISLDNANNKEAQTMAELAESRIIDTFLEVWCK